MSARLNAVALLGMVVGIATSATAAADEGATGYANPDSGVLGALAQLDLTPGPRSPDDGVPKPRCTFTPLSTSMVVGPTSSDAVARRDAATKAPTSAPAGSGTETLYRRECPGQAADFVWAPDGVDEDDLVDSALQRVERQVPSPALNMSPDPSVGGVVNIGLWLAVADPGQVSVTASVGPVWATVTARYERTVWQLGNGDSVECAGVGTPIVDLDTVEQGPCGYTYRWPSAPQFTGTDDLAYHASVTGRWVVSYVTSSGRAGSLTPIARTADFLYQVREIQTVRVAGDG